MRQLRGEIGIMMQKSIALPRITVKECLNLIRSYYRQPLSYDEVLDLAQLKRGSKVCEPFIWWAKASIDLCCGDGK